MDGNNSAKRVASAALVDFARFDSDYFLPLEEVDRFKDEVKGRRREQGDDRRVRFIPFFMSTPSETSARQILTTRQPTRVKQPTHHGCQTDRHLATSQMVKLTLRRVPRTGRRRLRSTARQPLISIIRQAYLGAPAVTTLLRSSARWSEAANCQCLRTIAFALH